MTTQITNSFLVQSWIPIATSQDHTMTKAFKIKSINGYSIKIFRNLIYSIFFKILNFQFLKSLFNSLLGNTKNKTKEFFESHIVDHPTTVKPYYYSGSSSYQATNKPYEPAALAATEDAFYKLKMHCSRTYDDLCSTKRKEVFKFYLS